MKKNGKYEGKLIAFDFDGTITNKDCHSHNYLIKQKIIPLTTGNGLIVNGNAENLTICKKYDPELVEKTFLSKLEEKEEFLRTPKLFLETIRGLIKEGAKVAIVSFNQYPAVFKAALLKIGFSEEEILKFNIISGFPIEDNNKVGKNEHLKKLKELTGIRNNEDIMLVDDSFQNCLVAQKCGYTILQVFNDDYLVSLIKSLDFLENFQKILNKENNPLPTEEIFNQIDNNKQDNLLTGSNSYSDFENFDN